MPASAVQRSRRDRLSEPELTAWRGLLRVHAALVKALDAELEERTGVPLSSYEVLQFLEEAPGRQMRMRDLADSVVLSRSGLTRLVDRMVREGYVERRSCESDGRGQFAVLTASGLAALRAARPVHLAGVRERFLMRFDDRDLVRLAEYWDRVATAASESPATE